MFTASCPNCGAEIQFRSTALPIRVCDFCRSTVLRKGETLEKIGLSASVPEDVSPLQIGSRGRDRDRPFELIGRVRRRWTHGAWSEWLMLFADGTHGWLSEAAGRWMFLHALDPQPAAEELVARFERDDQIVGSAIAIAGVDYQVNDARQVECIGSEGELPSAPDRDLRAISIDLLNDNGQCASVQKEGGAVHTYAGRCTSLAALKMRDLRHFEGWALPDFGQ